MRSSQRVDSGPSTSSRQLLRLRRSVTPRSRTSKAVSTRTQTPPVYSTYGKYKPHLRDEFVGRCVYCRAHEGPRYAYDEYGIDHYRPKSLPQFKHLACAYSNLFYCCPACNRRKGRYWPADGKEATEFIPNPCDHVMFEHMVFRDGEVISKTEAGRKACELLGLNHESVVTWRRIMLRCIEALEGQVGALTRQLAAANAKVAKGEVLPRGTIQRIQGGLGVATDSIRFLRGE